LIEACRPAADHLLDHRADATGALTWINDSIAYIEYHLFSVPDEHHAIRALNYFAILVA
jgi:hypothetical protein